VPTRFCREEKRKREGVSKERIQRFKTEEKKKGLFFCRPKKKTRPPHAPDKKEGEDTFVELL
tara:strand:- start:1144 stop:1329 length:186 start_codon:yes stop_codon:yes gene_type:complete